MKPTSVAEFMKRARDAGHDPLGIANDLEAIMALAIVQRNAFVRERSEPALRRWRELVSQIASQSLPDDTALFRWLAVEHVRLGVGFRSTNIEDAALMRDVGRWSERLDPTEQRDEARRFMLDMAAPLVATVAAKRG